MLLVGVKQVLGDQSDQVWFYTTKGQHGPLHYHKQGYNLSLLLT